MAERSDDLLRPTVPGHAARPGPAPWQLGSQLWVWFFGGPLAGGPIAWMNARRLGLPPGRVGAVAGLALLTLGIHGGMLAYWLATDASGTKANLRLATRVVALLGGFAVNRVMRDADRAFTMLDAREHASLWVPGLIAVVAAIVVTIAVLAFVRVAMA